jgi:hypothetical protein
MRRKICIYKCDIWSQASYRYPMSWEACLDPSDSYFLFTEFVGFYTHWTYIHNMAYLYEACDRISDCCHQQLLRKMRRKMCIYRCMFNVYKNQQIRQTGSNSFFVALFSATIDGRNLIFDHKLHICTPYRGKRFWTHQIITSCLSNLLIFIHIEHTSVEKNATKNEHICSMCIKTN